jgi:endoglucanase
LEASWSFYQVQRSGPIPSEYPIPWVYTSFLNDTIVGGWFDAGDTLKLNFPMAATVSFLSWGLVDFQSTYISSGVLTKALETMRVAVDYLSACQIEPRKYIGQIGEPDIDHSFWGRPSQYPQNTLKRNAYIWNATMEAADLLGSVAAALASASMAYKESDPMYSERLMIQAKDLYEWGKTVPGIYSNYYKWATTPYPSSNWQDQMAWAAAWLFRATGDVTYAEEALNFFTAAGGDVYSCWDSFWGPTASMMLSLQFRGVEVPGALTYSAWFNGQFLAAWLNPSGIWSIVQTPKGMAYPSWSKWGNLRYATTAAMVAIMHAQYNSDAEQKADEIAFAQRQADYALGSTGRSFVSGWWYNYPLQPHHAAASCPDLPAPCGWEQFSSPAPNPQVLPGAMVAGPGGVKLMADYANKNPPIIITDPDQTYFDVRSDYEVRSALVVFNISFT